MKKLIFILITSLALSTVHAQQWQEVESGTNKHLNAISFGSHQVGYIAAQDTILLKTTDGGDSWFEQKTSGFNFWNGNGVINHLEFVNDSVGYATTGSSAANGQLYITVDGGKTWNRENVPMCFASRVYAFDEENAVAVGTDCFIGKAVAIKENGVWKRTANFTWWSLSLLAVDFRNKDYGVVAGEGGEVYRTTNAGESWDTIPTWTKDPIRDLRFVDDSTLFAVIDSQQNTLMYSLDSGSTWKSHDNSLTFFYPRLTALAISSQSQVVAVGRVLSHQGTGYALSGNAYSDLWGGEPSKHKLNAIAFANDTLAYAVGDSGLIIRNDDLSLSVKRVRNHEHISVYPNPVGERLFLKSKSLRCVCASALRYLGCSGT